MKEYICYNCGQFDRRLFQPISNTPLFSKPTGGLWASDVNAKFGWKDWCQSQGYSADTEGTFGYSEDNCFKFTLSDNANVVSIKSNKDIAALPLVKNTLPFELPMTCIDFEECVRRGIDAIELYLSENRELYWSLYGWDCDSILVMNPDVVVVKQS